MMDNLQVNGEQPVHLRVNHLTYYIVITSANLTLLFIL